MLGYITAVVARIKEAEEGAAERADTGREHDSGPSTALVLADRALVVQRQAEQAYPRTHKTRVSYSGSGYRDGYAEGRKADIGSTKIGSRATKPISS